MDSATTWPVSFHAGTKNTYQLAGRGEVAIDAERFILRGRTRAQFSFQKMREFVVPLADIKNVVRQGNFVRMSTSADGKVVAFLADDEATASAIVERLPTEITEEFRQQVVETSDFYERLQTLGGRPIVVPAIVALNVIAFFIEFAAGAGLMDPNGEVLIRLGSNYGPLTTQGEWWRLLTSTFLHFGLIHIALNMWALWGSGQLVEALYGRVQFIVLYLFAGLSGSLCSLFVHPSVNSAGASGAIFGVFGGLLAFMVRKDMEVPKSIMLAHRNSVLVFIFYNLVIGASHPGIDNSAHIGGLAGGFLFGLLTARPFTAEARAQGPRRQLIGALIAIVVLLLASWPVVHPNTARSNELQFLSDYRWYAERESGEVAKMKAVFQTKTENREALADRIDRELLPFWEEAAQRFGREELITSDATLARRQAFFRATTDARLDWFRYRSRALRMNDADAYAKSQAAEKRLQTLYDEFEKK
jgi:rhomboid protease GluP